MKEERFTDTNGEVLVVKHRKSAIFLERQADLSKPNSYGNRHAEYVCITELKRTYRFSKEEFQRFYDYCLLISKESWVDFIPKESDSRRSSYDEYYDRNFDNNGGLAIFSNGINIEGPYAQMKADGEMVRLTKFTKRTFESFIYDLDQAIHSVKIK